MRLLISGFNLYFCLCGKLFNSGATSSPNRSSSSSYFSLFLLVNLLFKTFDISLIIYIIASSSARMISGWFTFFNDTDFCWTAACSLKFFNGADSASVVNDSVSSVTA